MKDRVRDTESIATIGRPAVGFGCSSLTSVGRKKALHLLESAFDCGIRHFDVARCYGYGESENLLGTFVKRRRSEVTLTTKFGIEPPRRTGALRTVLWAGRRFLQVVPSARKVLQQHTSVLVSRGAFDIKSAQRSLDISLRELGTDYIDFFLLHDYAPTDHSSGELADLLRQAVRAGKIRYFGLGTNIDNVTRALDQEPELCGVIQFQNSVLARNRDKLSPKMPHGVVITHGALGGGYRCLSSFLKDDRNRLKDWSERLGINCADERILVGLMLNYAVEANPGGLVLFSARSADRIRINADSVLNPRVTSVQVRSFARLVEQNLQALAHYSFS